MPRRKWIVSFCAVVLGAVIGSGTRTSVAQAQSDQKGRIAGIVSGADGKPASNVTVRLLQAPERGQRPRDDGGGGAADPGVAANKGKPAAGKGTAKRNRTAVAETKTDSSGAFAFPDMAAGRYVVVAGDKGGPRGHTAVTLAEGGTAKVSVTLKERGAKGGKAGKRKGV